ncbi:Protein-tyrosine-phosphatase MKP1 [Linum perenne]
MLGQDETNHIGPPAAAPRKTYLRSVSWSDHSPRRPNNPRPQPSSNHSKARSSLPPLQPLSITRPPAEEWPRAGSDDLGVWPNLNPQTPRSGPLTPQPQPQREFQFKREKLAFFDKECSRIADHIYLGSDAVAKNREILRQNGITHVLNCVGFVSPEYFKNDLVYKTLWLQDSPSEDITSILYDVFDYFEDVREQGGKVLVHCCQGVSRSNSLVIAYLMWREGQSFEDAFQYVKAARGVTNPNMGFACQLLQCQKRVHAVPASPNSVLRMYRMAPHSSYDSLHLVPKMVSQPGMGGLDSRGAFIVHVPSTVFVWIGKKCCTEMSNHARVAANQVIRYERARGPFVYVVEGDEGKEFWDALGWDGNGDNGCCGERKVNEYDSDFELFDKAIRGGVVPSCSVSNSGVETCLPAREVGWGKLRMKFASGVMKEFLSSSNSDTIMHEGEEGGGEQEEEQEQVIADKDSSLASTPCGSPDSYVSCSPDPDQKFQYKSPPMLSPSASGYSSSSFTFSPGSSNWSDSSCLSSSQQPSPSGLEQHIDPLISTQKGTLNSPTKVFPFSPDSGLEKATTSIAARRGSNAPPLVVLPVIDDEPASPGTLSKDETMKDAQEHW